MLLPRPVERSCMWRIRLDAFTGLNVSDCIQYRTYLWILTRVLPEVRVRCTFHLDFHSSATLLECFRLSQAVDKLGT